MRLVLGSKGAHGGVRRHGKRTRGLDSLSTRQVRPSPTGSGATGPLSCKHFEGNPGTDDCPDHGNTIAGLAKSCPAPISVVPGSDSCSQAVRNVYAGGVAGHDHVMDFPGGADWNVAWEPIIVLFTNANAANTRLLTDAQIDAAIASHERDRDPTSR